MKYLTIFITCLVLNACSMKVEKTYQSSEGDLYVVKVENNHPVILHTFASNGHTRIVDKCVVFDDKNWECDNSLRMKNGIFYKFDELLQEASSGSTKSIREGGAHGLSMSNTQKEESQIINTNVIDINKSYKELRNEILSTGWNVYRRNNEIKDWDKYRPYPELDYCREDICQASFINNDKTKVREVIYGHCSPDGYSICSNKPRGFELPQKDIVISKSESDKNFLNIKFKIED